MYTATHRLYLNLADADLNSFVPAWAAYRGVLATPSVGLDTKARETHLGLTPHFVRLIRNRNVDALENEFALELLRRTNYPQAISRLNCIYTWPDEATARLAPAYWANQGRHFDEKYLVEIGVHSNRQPTIVDTRWIDKYVFNTEKPFKEIGVDWIHEYWRGSEYPWKRDKDIPEQPLRECLVDGTATVHGTALRMEAFALVEKIEPATIGILEAGRLAVDLCTRFGGTDEWRLGYILPIVTRRNGKDISVSHIINQDDALIKSLIKKIPSSGIKKEEINHRAIALLQNTQQKLPDLRALNVDASWINDYQVLKNQFTQILYNFFLEHGGDVAKAVKFNENDRRTQS